MPGSASALASGSPGRSLAVEQAASTTSGAARPAGMAPISSAALTRASAPSAVSSTRLPGSAWQEM